MKSIKIITLIIASLLVLSALASCDLPLLSNETESESESGSASSGGSSGSTTEAERFDYLNSDMKDYIAIDKSAYTGVNVSLPTYLNGSEGAVAEYIKLLCETYPESTGNKITDQPIKKGDTVALYYEGWLEGVKFEGGSNMDDEKPYSLTIGSGTFIPGFEEGLIGLIPANNSRDNLYDLYLTFPSDYHSADLAGKAVVFKVYVEYIDEKAPAEYNDSFIKDTLGYSTTATDVKADFEKYLKETYLPSMKENEMANLIWEEITEKAVILNYPEGELEYFSSSYESQYKQYYDYYYKNMFSSYDEFMKAYFGNDWKKEFEEQSKIDVEQNLIFHYIAQVEGMTITETDYQNAIQYYIDYYAEQNTQLTAKEVEQYFGERMIKEQALWTKVQNFLIANCNVVYENK